MRNRLDLTIARLGECHVPSPMSGVRFTRDDERVLYHASFEDMKPWLDEGEDPPAMEVAGPRERLFFDPKRLACGIVTCGGICPGLNDVIRALVLSLHHHYGVRKVYGFRFGYEGLVRQYGHEPLELTADAVNRIHEIGGSVLGSSRGPQDPAEMVQTLEDLKIGILFAIGGDGTLRGRRRSATKRRGAASGSASSASRRRSTTTSRSYRGPSDSRPPSPRRGERPMRPTPRRRPRATGSGW